MSSWMNGSRTFDRYDKKNKVTDNICHLFSVLLQFIAAQAGGL